MRRHAVQAQFRCSSGCICTASASHDPTSFTIKPQDQCLASSPRRQILGKHQGFSPAKCRGASSALRMEPIATLSFWDHNDQLRIKELSWSHYRKNGERSTGVFILYVACVCDLKRRKCASLARVSVETFPPEHWQISLIDRC
jgi:hypothetical protein